MKLFIVISSLTLLLGFSTSRLLILQYRNLTDYCQLQEDNWKNFDIESTNIPDALCEELENSPIFVDEFSGRDGYHFKAYEPTRTESVVQQTSVLVGFNKKTIPTLSCEYDGSTVYLAKHSNCEHILLFKQLESYIPSLFAMAIEEIEFENGPMISTKEFHILLKEYNSIEKYNQWSNVNFVFREEVKIFQLCMTLLLHTTNENLAKIRIWLKLGDHGSDRRIRDKIYIEKTRDLEVATEMDLNAEEYGIAEVLFRTYYVPTIICNTTKILPLTRTTTFFFLPHPHLINNKIFYYYMRKKDNLLLYSRDHVYSVVLQ